MMKMGRHPPAELFFRIIDHLASGLTNIDMFSLLQLASGPVHLDSLSFEPAPTMAEISARASEDGSPTDSASGISIACVV